MAGITLRRRTSATENWYRVLLFDHRALFQKGDRAGPPYYCSESLTRDSRALWPLCSLFVLRIAAFTSQELITQPGVDGSLAQPDAKVSSGEVRTFHDADSLAVQCQLGSTTRHVGERVAVPWLHVAVPRIDPVETRTHARQVSGRRRSVRGSGRRPCRSPRH